MKISRPDSSVDIEALRAALVRAFPDGGVTEIYEFMGVRQFRLDDVHWLFKAHVSVRDDGTTVSVSGSRSQSVWAHLAYTLAFLAGVVPFFALHFAATPRMEELVGPEVCDHLGVPRPQQDLGKPIFAIGFTLLGALLLGVGHYAGLFVAPPEAMMGDIGRILYVHVPTAWLALVTYFIAFIAACGALASSKDGWDATAEAAVEVGVVLTALLLFQGSMWAKPTWGTYWTWDPRLTTTAIMGIAFTGVLVLRALIHDHDRRRTISSVATILAFVDVPIVYMSVKWWKSLHQVQSSPETVSDPMVWVLRTAAFGMLFLSIGFILFRRRIALDRMRAEHGASALPEKKTPISLEIT